MMKCPKCSKNLVWQVSEQMDEDHYFNLWWCGDCDIEVLEHFREEFERLSDVEGNK